MKFYPIILLALLLVAFSCTSDTECRQDSLVRLKVSYYAMLENEQTNIPTAQKVTIDSLNIWGVDNDSILYKDKKGVREIYLPLQKNKELSQFVFQYKNITDTLTINHTNTTNFISLECGCFIYHTLTDLKSNNSIIDSIVIINQQVTTLDEEHIQLFF